MPRALADRPRHDVDGQPGREQVDPLLDGASRLVVVGTDADLAAVAVRLLRRERLDVEVAYVPSGRSAARRVWALPRGRRAAALALRGDAVPTPLIRAEKGGVLVGAATLRGTHGDALRGEAYVDSDRVFVGRVQELRARAGVDGVSASVRRGHWLTGRAVQLGCTGCEVVSDGAAAGHGGTRWAFYRHTQDWLLVRPA